MKISKKLFILLDQYSRYGKIRDGLRFSEIEKGKRLTVFHYMSLSVFHKKARKLGKTEDEITHLRGMFERGELTT